MKFKKGVILWLALLGLFIFYPQCVSSQTITKENYKEKYKESIKLINKEDLENASALTYKLIDFIRDNRRIYKDSTDILLSKNYWNLTSLYLWKNQELSLKYADSTINIALRTNSPGTKQRAYSIKYYCLYDVKGYEKTLDFLADECIKYSLQTDNYKMLGESYMHKCNSMVELGKANQATDYCNKAVEAFKQVGDEGYLASVYNNIGNVFTKKKETKRALEFYEKSHEISLRIEPAIEISKSARNIAEKNEELKNFQKSSEYYRVYGDSLKSHMDEVLNSKFAEAESKYQVEQKDKEIAQKQLEIAKAKNTRNLYIIIILVFFMLIVAYLQYRYNKQKRQKLSAENDLVKEQEINEMRTKFLGNISHEIRTPLTLISGNIQLAKEKIQNGKDAQKYLDMALSNSKQVIDDANEILHILKFEKGKQEVNLEETAIQKFCKRVFLSFDSAANDKDISLEFTSAFDDDVNLNIDQNKTEKIINNLLTNALKFSSSKSKVLFNLCRKGEQLEITVTDFGVGIHKEDQEKIFDRFYQSQKTKSIGGIGIGLALSREFASLLGGSLAVNSTFGEGSSFTLLLPYSEVDKQPEAIDTIEFHQDANKPKVLIVEDNVEMSKFLSEILSEHYDITVSFDGADAYEKIKKYDFDLISSDVMMPKVDGFELREKVSELNDKKEIPFILITAKHLEIDKIKGYQLGINDYIVKPFNKNELLARVANLIENSANRKAWKVENKELFEATESYDKKLLDKLQKIVVENITNEDFKIDDLAKEIGYSQRQLSRILNEHTGMSPIKFVLEIRLQKAYQLLQNKTYSTLAEVKYDIGISSTSYFNTKFKERFGIKPGDFLS